MATEKRLINANSRIEEIKKTHCTNCENYGGVKCRACWVDDAIGLIDDAPTVDAVEVVHGRWIPLEADGYADGSPVWDLWECSECRDEHSGDEDTLTPYCHNCGAKMDRERRMIMKKNIACHNCKGKGYNTVVTGDRNDYCGVTNEMCPECNGTGVQLADMTKADRIRAMSDEELADKLHQLYLAFSGEEYCDFGKLFCDGNAGCISAEGEVTCNDECQKACIVRWLRQPTEEATHAT